MVGEWTDARHSGMLEHIIGISSLQPMQYLEALHYVMDALPRAQVHWAEHWSVVLLFAMLHAMKRPLKVSSLARVEAPMGQRYDTAPLSVMPLKHLRAMMVRLRNAAACTVARLKTASCMAMKELLLPMHPIPNIQAAASLALILCSPMPQMATIGLCRLRHALLMVLQLRDAKQRLCQALCPN